MAVASDPAYDDEAHLEALTALLAMAYENDRSRDAEPQTRGA